MISTLLIDVIFFCLACIASALQAPPTQGADDRSMAPGRIHYQSAVTALQKNEVKTSLAEIQQAIKLSPRNAEYRNQFALALFHDKNMAEMWKQLRIGARLDPNHQKLAKGLTSYWNFFDKQGLFNFGSPLDEVRQKLGDPDQQLIHPSQELRQRWVYGFLAVEFYDGKVDQTLDLRGLRANHFQPMSQIRLAAPLENWQVSYRTNNRYSSTTEWTFNGEAIQNWTQLVSFQRLHGVGKTTKSVNEISDGIISGLLKSYPDAKHQILNQSRDSILFEWSISGDENRPAQVEIVRLFRGPRDVHRLAYAKKTKQIQKALREEWIEILDSASLVSRPNSKNESPESDLGESKVDQN